MTKFTTSRKRITEIEKLKWFAESVQIEADNMAYKNIKLKRLLTLSCILDFSPLVVDHLVPLFINNDALEFLIKNNNQIERYFSIMDLIEYGKMFRIVSLIKQPVDLKHLKQIYLSIKPVK